MMTFDFALPNNDRELRRPRALEQFVDQGALAAAAASCRKRRRAVDVAAHVGAHSRALLSRFNQIEAFEPQPDCHDCLVRNTGATRVTPYRIGIAAKRGVGHINARVFKDSSQGQFETKGFSDSLPVAATTLDDFGWDDVDLIRLGPSADGLAVLAGAKALLQHTRPVIWITVGHPDRGGTERTLATMARMLGSLAASGYKCLYATETDFVLAADPPLQEVPAPLPACSVIYSNALRQRFVLVAAESDLAAAQMTASAMGLIRQDLWPVHPRTIRSDRGPAQLMRIDVSRKYGVPETLSTVLPGLGAQSSVRQDEPTDLADLFARIEMTIVAGGLDISLPVEVAAIFDELSVAGTRSRRWPGQTTTKTTLYYKAMTDIDNVSRIRVRLPRDEIRIGRLTYTLRLMGGGKVGHKQSIEVDLTRHHIAADTVICYGNRGGGGNDAIKAMAKSLGAPIFHAEDGWVPGVSVVWGVLRGSKAIINTTAAQGGLFYYIDHAYFDRGHRKSYRITRNRFEAGPVREVPRDRIDRQNITAAPWRTGGREIIVCPPTEYFKKAHDCHDWLEKTLAHLRKHSDRPIVLREKPQPGEQAIPLPEALQTAHALVAHSSNVAIEAAILGTPVFVSPSSAAAPVGLTDLSRIESPVFPDRDPWLAHLAYSQFSFEEMQSGEAWDILATYEDRPLVDMAVPSETAPQQEETTE